jgi:hypothetical protein
MLDFMDFGSTLILYGLLSEKPAGGIQTISFIGKNQKVEPFLLSVAMMGKKRDWHVKLLARA